MNLRDALILLVLSAVGGVASADEPKFAEKYNLMATPLDPVTKAVIGPRMYADVAQGVSFVECVETAMWKGRFVIEAGKAVAWTCMPVDPNAKD